MVLIAISDMSILEKLFYAKTLPFVLHQAHFGNVCNTMCISCAHPNQTTAPTMNRVYYNKSMLLTALLPMLLIVVSTLYLLLDGADKIRETFLFGVLDSPWLFYPVLLTLFATFAEYSWLSLRKVVRKKPAIRWGSGGVALAKDARVAWAAVENIELVKHKKNPYILLHIDHPIAFMDMQVGERKAEAKRCFKIFGTPVAIACSELAVDAHDLYLALQSQHQSFQAEQCSKP